MSATESGLFELSTEPYAAIDANGAIVRWNRAAERAFGWSRDALQGQPFAQALVAGGHQAETTQALEHCWNDGLQEGPVRSAIWIRHGDGYELPVDLIAEVDRGALPPLLRAWLRKREVPEQAASALLAAIVASSDDAIISKTLDGVVTSWNAAAERLFGYTASEAVGRPLVGLIIPKKYEHEETMILSRIRRGERVDHYDTVRHTKHGDTVEVSLTVSPVRDGSGRIVGASKIARDVSERRRAERALQEETLALELLNESGMALGSNLDLQSLLQTATDAGTKLTGAQFGAFFYNVIDGSGKRYMLYTLSGAPREAFESFGHPRATALFGPTFAGEGPIRVDDVLTDPRYGKSAPHFGMPKGHLPVRSYLAVAVKSRSGEVIGGLFFGHAETGVFAERSERVVLGIAAQAAVAIDNARLYEAAQRATADRESALQSERDARTRAERLSELKDDFLTTLSHELRTPLSAIVGWIQVLRRGPRDDADLQRGLETIERNARVQTQLIDDLLDMSRITAGKVRLDIQPVVPMVVIQSAVDATRPAAEAKGIRLEVILDPLAGPVSGDPDRLQQVIWNLLSNAIKFTPRGGKVQVVLERVNSHLEIAVADTGAGIPPDFLPFVFDRFRQADSSSSRRYGGLGLGLSIVKNLVELHGGTVVAKSRGEGHGATFVVSLPVAAVHRDTAPSRSHPKTAGDTPLDYSPMDLAGIKVLVVDDEPDAQELMRRLLSDSGAEPLTTGSAQEALAILQAERPAILISDIGMPGMDGYELLRAIRQLGDEQGGRIPAIALTAFARTEDRTRALRAGFLAHVAKPVDPAELVATVASVAGHWKP